MLKLANVTRKQAASPEPRVTFERAAFPLQHGCFFKHQSTAQKSLTFLQSSVNCSHLSTRVVHSKSRASQLSAFLCTTAHEIDHLSPSTIFSSLIESRIPISSPIASGSLSLKAVDDFLEHWESLPALALTASAMFATRDNTAVRACSGGSLSWSIPHKVNGVPIQVI